ncbi:mitochondrial transcription termination factor family protein [Actinidia rufa]|uniref:Mitochondrial transcription termination factor family protein n=1 Tax=Actinidia rufa TaxID=165716 RepID=A0A7J0EQ59_9ERIC|nr:mitochondrial transcription termination factor family protein [Actinidia rufa]
MRIERSALGRILDMYPQFLTSDPYSNLYPVFDFLLNDVVIPFHDTTVLLVLSVEGTLMPKLNYLMELRFSYEEVRRMVLRSPGLLTFSIENNYWPKVECFVKEMDGDLTAEEVSAVLFVQFGGEDKALASGVGGGGVQAFVARDVEGQ